MTLKHAGEGKVVKMMHEKCRHGQVLPRFCNNHEGERYCRK